MRFLAPGMVLSIPGSAVPTTGSLSGAGGHAHFLEHKLFENEDCDAFARYARTGASANAYTSFDMTCYLFSCTENVYESLEILLDFVQSPYFTEETIQKEQGIIGQEIKMYEDDPSWRVLFNALCGLYHVHPVKNDIAGTVESIAQITPEMLYRCYNTFYNLRNMVLCVAGNVETEKVLEVADRLLRKSEEVSVERAFLPEPEEIVYPYKEEALAVSFPCSSWALKKTRKKEEEGRRNRYPSGNFGFRRFSSVPKAVGCWVNQRSQLWL